MRKKKRFVVLGILILLGSAITFIFRIPDMDAERVEGTIVYNENSFYTINADNNYLIEVAEEGTIAQYAIKKEEDGTEKIIREVIWENPDLHIKYLVSSYWRNKIGADMLLITSDNRVFQGGMNELPGKELGTVNNAWCGDLGLNHTAILTDDGRLFVRGDNSKGALGLGIEKTEEFLEVPYLRDVRKVVCGVYSTVVLNSNGEVFLSGTLGNIRNDAFVKLDVPQKVKDISNSDAAETIVILNTEGNVYEMGTPHFIGWYDDWLYKDDTFYDTFQKIARLKNITKISRTDFFGGIAIDNAGRTFYWGGVRIGKDGSLHKTLETVKSIAQEADVWYRNRYLYVLLNDQIMVYNLNINKAPSLDTFFTWR